MAICFLSFPNKKVLLNNVIIQLLSFQFCQRSFGLSKRKPDHGKVLLDFSLTVKAAPHECVIRTSQP